MAPLLSDEPPDYPFVALLVSGGHTQLIRANAFGDYRLLGESVDDAAGEAFDKTAKLLDLPYPGGPHVAALAQTGNPDRFVFPRPMVKHPGLDFSFSGLKTHVATCIKQLSDAGSLDEQAKAHKLQAIQTGHWSHDGRDWLQRFPLEEGPRGPPKKSTTYVPPL